MEDRKIFFFWFELIAISQQVLHYIPRNFYEDKDFLYYLLKIYDINTLLKYHPIRLDLLDLSVLSKLDPGSLFMKYISNQTRYKPLITDDLILQLIRAKHADIIHSDTRDIVNVIYSDFNYLIDELLHINYKLYYCLPIVNRTHRLFSLIVPKLYIHFNCDDSMVELDNLYDAHSLYDLSDILNPTFNICKFYILKNIHNIKFVPNSIDISILIPLIISKLEFSAVPYMIVQYLTVEMCDIITENTIKNSHESYAFNEYYICYAKSILDYIPLHLISVKSAKKMLMNEAPDFYMNNCTLYNIIPFEDFNKICTDNGLINLLDKKYHTYEIYNNYVIRRRQYSLLARAKNLRYNNINFNLLDAYLLSLIVVDFDIIYTAPDLIRSHPDLIYVVESYLFTSIPNSRSSFTSINQRIIKIKQYKDEFNYLILKFPVLELYSDEIPSFESFNSILYENDITLHIKIINQLFSNYEYDDCIQTIKYLISHKNISYIDIDKKYHTADLFILYCNVSKSKIDSYFIHNDMPPELDNEDTWHNLYLNNKIYESTIPNKYRIKKKDTDKTKSISDFYIMLANANNDPDKIREIVNLYLTYDFCRYDKWVCLKYIV